MLRHAVTRRSPWLALTLALALPTFLAGGCSSAGDDRAAQGDDEKAPQFELQTLQGDMVRLADYSGKVVLVDFWATWCPPCRRQIPHLTELYSELNADGFEVLGVAVGDREPAVRQFIEKLGIPYPNAMSTDRIVTDFGNFTEIPTAFLVDRQGNIAKRYTGLQDRAVLERAIRSLLDEA